MPPRDQSGSSAGSARHGRSRNRTGTSSWTPATWLLDCCVVVNAKTNAEPAWRNRSESPPARQNGSSTERPSAAERRRRADVRGDRQAYVFFASEGPSQCRGQGVAAPLAHFRRTTIARSLTLWSRLGPVSRS